MSSLGILDLVLGLFFIYFVFSVICTSIVEGVAQFFSWRSKELEELVKNFFLKSLSDEGKAGKLKDELLKHKLIDGLTKKGRNPDYFSANIFTSALFSLVIKKYRESEKMDNTNSVFNKAAELRQAIEKSHILPDDLRDYLLQAFEDGNNALGSLTLVKNRLESWFDQSMERVIGTYKKRTRALTFWIALLLVGMANVDSIALIKYLKDNPAATAKLVDAATREAQDSVLYYQTKESLNNIKEILGKDSTKLDSKLVSQTLETLKNSKTQADSLYKDLAAMGLPLGWKGEKIEAKCGWWGSKIIGLLLTTFALVLGAPFWFDMINKLVNIRSAGNKPDTTSSSAASTNVKQTPAG